MELLIILILFVIIIAAMISAVALGVQAIFAAGYYLTLPALGMITASAATIWGVVYYRAPWSATMNRYGQRTWNSKTPKADILFRGYCIGAVLGIVWVIAFFANWDGTSQFFHNVLNFFLRSGA